MVYQFAGFVLIVLFVLWEARQDEPLLPLSLFRNRNFSLANIVSAIVAFGMLGLFLQSVLGLTALQAGLTLYAIGMGLVIWVASLHSTGATFTVPLIVAGIGMGCTFAPMVTVAMRTSRRDVDEQAKPKMEQRGIVAAGE